MDQHFKFHASAALKSALTRAKACVVVRDESFAMPPPLVDRVLTALWANWEDPLSQTVKEVQGAFEALADLFSKSNGFLERVASRLLERGVSSKGRYVPLAALVPKLGARKLLDIRPNLLEESLDAMRDDSVCCAAGTLIKELSAKLLDEMEEEERAAAAAARESSPGPRNDRRASVGSSVTEAVRGAESTRGEAEAGTRFAFARNAAPRWLRGDGGGYHPRSRRC